MRFRHYLRQTLLIAALCAFFSISALAQDPSWQKDLAAWRAQYVENLLKPDGWLSLTGLEWLQLGDNSLGSALDNKIHLAAGNPAHLAILHLEGETVTLNPPPGGFPPDFLVAGAPAKPQALRAEPNNDKVSPHLTIGTLNLYVIRREERFALRIKDSHSPAIVGFHGLNLYPPDASYRVTAKWIPYSPPKTITLATLVGTKYDQPVPGAAEFTLQGKTFRLEPVLEDPAVAKLFFILRDTTSTTTTSARAASSTPASPQMASTNPASSSWISIIWRTLPVRIRLTPPARFHLRAIVCRSPSPLASSAITELLILKLFADCRTID
jgi:uncharacterized protein (DUF1684 family)